jgi:hypothetical protein
MTEKKQHGESCPMCTLTKSIFGTRFNGCGEVANIPATEAHALIQQRMTEYQHEARAQLEAGKISEDEYSQFIQLLSESYSYAAAMIPAMALMSGARTDPISLMQLVQKHITRAAALMLEASGLGPIMGALRGMLGGDQGESEDEEPEEPVSLSQLN